MNADTDKTGYDTGTFGSVDTTVTGEAVRAAAVTLKSQILALAQRYTGAVVETCALADGEVRCNGSSLPLTNLLSRAKSDGLRENTQAIRVPFPLTCRAFASPCTVSPARSRS